MKLPLAPCVFGGFGDGVRSDIDRFHLFRHLLVEHFLGDVGFLFVLDDADAPVVLETGAGGDQLTDNDVLFQTEQTVGLSVDCHDRAVGGYRLSG